MSALSLGTVGLKAGFVGAGLLAVGSAILAVHYGKSAYRLFRGQENLLPETEYLKIKKPFEAAVYEAILATGAAIMAYSCGTIAYSINGALWLGDAASFSMAKPLLMAFGGFVLIVASILVTDHRHKQLSKDKP